MPLTNDSVPVCFTLHTLTLLTLTVVVEGRSLAMDHVTASAAVACLKASATLPSAGRDLVAVA